MKEGVAMSRVKQGRTGINSNGRTDIQVPVVARLGHQSGPESSLNRKSSPGRPANRLTRQDLLIASGLARR